MADPLDFGVDLGDVATRARAMKYFTSVTDILEASEVLDETIPARAPAAFVAISAERAEENKTIGGHSQRVRVEVTIMFVEQAARMDQGTRDRMDATKRAIVRQFVAFTPKGAGERLNYARYRVIKIGGGFAFGEVSFTTSYRLTI